MRIARGIGGAWVGVAQDVEHELRYAGYQGDLAVFLTPDGLLDMKIRSRDKVHRQIVVEGCKRAARMCERCGRPGTIRSGPVLRIVCEQCEQR